MSGKNGSIAAPFSAWERSVASRYLRAKRNQGGVALISIISFAGITLAVAALIIVMSVMNGFRAELLSRILGFNGHAYVTGSVLTSPAYERATQQLRATPNVTQAIPMIEAQAMAIGQGQITGVIVRGVTPDDLRHIDIIANNIKAGSLSTFGQGEYGGDNLIIGQRLAEQLGVRVGDVISIISPSGDATAFGSTPRQKDYVVGGIFSVGMSEYDAAFVYMPLEQAQLFFGREQAIDVIEVKLTDPDRAKEMKPALMKAGGPGSIVEDWTEKNSSFFEALQVERTAMRLILMVVVAVVALNIISGLVMLVKNKSRDIAILRTIGATRGSILRVFFMAGASIGALGTGAGLLLGILFCVFIQPIQRFVEFVTGAHVFNADVYFLSHLPAKVDPVEVAVIIVFSLGMSFFWSVLPAWWASRLDPVEALRFE